jgi:radical SAM superfamily enzyme YgiQ (UPF0313 family)
MPLKTLLLNPPLFEQFDGGASSRWPATREIESYWDPVWLAYPAAMIPDSRLLDAPPHGISLEATVRIAKEYDFVVLFTSTAGFASDIRLIDRMKAVVKPSLTIAVVVPHVTVLPEQSLMASDAIAFVVRGEFEYAVTEFAEGAPLEAIKGVSFRQDGRIVHTESRPLLHNLDALSWVTPIYQRDLGVRRYNVPFLRHPYIAFYTARGCPAQCTFCLWPQTFTGHLWRQRSVDDVLNEVQHACQLFPDVAEIFFDDDTFTPSARRACEPCASA